MVFEFLLGMSETLLCSMSALQAKVVRLLDALQLLILFAGTLTYLETKRFLSVILYSGTFLIINIFVVFNMNTYICFSPHHDWRELIPIIL
jgi:hypothetical protein